VGTVRVLFVTLPQSMSYQPLLHGAEKPRCSLNAMRNYSGCSLRLTLQGRRSGSNLPSGHVHVVQEGSGFRRPVRCRPLLVVPRCQENFRQYISSWQCVVLKPVSVDLYGVLRSVLPTCGWGPVYRSQNMHRCSTGRCCASEPSSWSSAAC
jgi:hypothetical protein